MATLVTNQSLTSLLCSTPTNPRNPHDYQEIGPHSVDNKSVECNLLQMDIQSVFDKIMSQMHVMNENYRQFSNISRTQSPNINVSRLVLQLSLPNPLKPRVKLRMKM